MKNISFTAILFFILTVVSGQTIKVFPIDTASKKVVYTGIVTLDTTMKAKHIFDALKEWFSTDISNFYITSSEKSSGTNDAIWGTKKANMATVDLSYKNDQPLKMSDPDTKKLVGRAVIKYFGTSYGCVRLLYLTFDIKVQCKDGKYKYDVTNFDYTHYNHYNASKIGFNTLTDKGVCKSTGNIEDLLLCDNCSDGLEKFYIFIDNSVKNILKSMNEYALTAKPASDW
jgi:hypothetical protein